MVVDRASTRYCFRCTLDSYQSRAENLSYQILGDRAMAEDATQEAFMSAYKAFGSFRGDNLRAWLLRIVSNTCRDMLRVRKSRPSISLDYTPGTLEDDRGPAMDFPSTEESPEDHALRQELAEVIQQGLQTLPEERRLAASLIDV